ncbi:MAG: hypothetical protein U1F43_16580 [Myxococcota bacterium]
MLGLATMLIGATLAAAGPPSWLGPDVPELPRWRFVPWRDSSMAVDPLLGQTWALASDGRARVIHTDLGALIERRGAGFVGVVPKPLTFAALDPRGEVLASDAAGRTLHAPLARAAELAAYLPLPGSRRVRDVARQHWVATDGDRLVRSSDGGATWKDVDLVGVVDARVRYDGTIVARTAAGWSRVSPRGQVAATDPRAPAGASLHRIGAWIFVAGDLGIVSDRTPVPTLASDGRTWLAKPPLPEVSGAGFVQMFDNWLGYAAREGDPERWLGEAPLAAPRPPTPAEQLAAMMAADSPDEIAGVMGFGGPRGNAPPPCEGTRCYHVEPLPPIGSQRVARFLGDAVAARGASRESGPFVRPAAVAVVDTSDGTTRVVRAPAECQPLLLTAARGLVLLECRDRVYALAPGADGDWVEELRTPVSGRFLDLAMADDGTALLADIDGGVLRGAWLRHPEEVAAGTTRWRDVFQPDALFVAPLSGARAVMAIARRPGLLAVALLDASTPPTEVGTMAINAPLEAIAWDGRQLSATAGGVRQRVPVSLAP